MCCIAKAPRLLTACAALFCSQVLDAEKAIAPSSVLPAATAAHDEYRAIEQLSKMRNPAGPLPSSANEQSWLYDRNNQIHERGLAFLRTFPSDSLRWDVVVLMRFGPYFVHEVEEAGQKYTTRDSQRHQQWNAQYRQMLIDLIAAPDASRDARRTALEYLIMQLSLSVASKRADGSDQKIGEIRRLLDLIIAENPRSSFLMRSYQAYAEALNAIDPHAYVGFLAEVSKRHSTNHPGDRQMREFVEGKLRLIYGESTPLWLRLFSLDGQLTETFRLRGKVILIAVVPITWEAQVDFLHSVQREFQSSDLVVIQVTDDSDNTRYGATISSAQATEIARSKGLNWPVVWDPRQEVGQFARMVSINTTPTWLIVARDGRFVTNAMSRNLFDVLRRELELPGEP